MDSILILSATVGATINENVTISFIFGQSYHNFFPPTFEEQGPLWLLDFKKAQQNR